MHSPRNGKEVFRRGWRDNWNELATFFRYPYEIRKHIYTTNAIEEFNRQLRKVTKTRTVFPTDDSLFKILFLAMKDITAISLWAFEESHELYPKTETSLKKRSKNLSASPISFPDRISDEDFI